MDIELLVSRAYTSWAYGKGTVWTDHMREALTELAAGYEQRIKQMEAERVPEGLLVNLTTGLDEITGLCRHLRQGGCDSSDLRGLEEGLIHAIDMASEMLSMLATATAKEGE